MRGDVGVKLSKQVHLRRDVLNKQLTSSCDATMVMMQLTQCYLLCHEWKRCCTVLLQEVDVVIADAVTTPRTVTSSQIAVNLMWDDTTTWCHEDTSMWCHEDIRSGVSDV